MQQSMSDLQNYAQKTNLKFRCAIDPRIFPGCTAGPRILASEGLRTVQSMREREKCALGQGYTNPRRLVDYFLYSNA